jgi:hypothetical protein
VWRSRVDSTPNAIALAVKQHAPHAVRLGSKVASCRAGCSMS